MSSICVPKSIWSNGDCSLSIHLPLSNLIPIAEERPIMTLLVSCEQVDQSGPKNGVCHTRRYTTHIPLPEKTFCPTGRSVVK